MPRHPKQKAGKTTIVYHVGAKPVIGGRLSRSFSQEGGELSISRHPNEWSDIARLGGEVWQLHKAGARFLRVSGSRLPRATAWAVQHSYLIPTTVWRVWLGYDDELKDETYQEFFTREEAEEQADDCDGGRGGRHRPGEVEEVAGHRFGPLGEAYWQQNFDEPVGHGWAEAFAPIFYARAHGYDGVWYNETYDPARLSCPRGLILQEKLPEWSEKRFERPR